MAVWMEVGSAVSAGSSWSRAASTARRSSSKKGESFIVGWNPSGQPQSQTSQFGLPLGIKRFCDELAIRFLEQDFHAALGFFRGSGFLGAGVFTKYAFVGWRRSFLTVPAPVCRAAALLDALNCRSAPA